MAAPEIGFGRGAARSHATPDPSQQSVFEQPRVVTPAAQESEKDALVEELREKGFTARQATEAIHWFDQYAERTRQWQAAYAAVARSEMDGTGFRSKAFAFMNVCRQVPVRFREPKVLDWLAVEKIAQIAFQKHDKTTTKVAGGLLGIVVAILLKAFLLWPMAASFLDRVMGEGTNLTKSAVAFLLAAVLAYSITYAMRFVMQLFVSVYGSEKVKEARTLGDLLKPVASLVMFIICVLLLGWVLFSFLRYDIAVGSAAGTAMGGEGKGPFASYGLNGLFLLIIIVYELSVSYRTVYSQLKPPKDRTDELLGAYHEAKVAYDSEQDLGRLRALTLMEQQRWAAFLGQLDSGDYQGKRAPRLRARAMAALRASSTEFVSTSRWRH